MLEKFFAVKRKEIEELEKLRQEGLFPTIFSGQRPDFKQALQIKNNLPAVIAEFKQASPSKGLICTDLSVEDVVQQYNANGASALSILTEKQYFAGDLTYIDRAYNIMDLDKQLPILRKDFIFDPIQIEVSACTPASAILLIVRMIDNVKKLRELREQAEKYKLQCVVEVFDEKDLQQARESGAEIIQVNARDLKTLKVDRQACLNLAKNNPPQNDEVWIAASGIENHAHLRLARDAGYHVVLVGSSLMKDAKPGLALARLLRA